MAPRESDRRTEQQATAADKPPEVAGRKVPTPRHRGPRIALGVALVIGGLLGALPVLGFWMLPLGLAVLSVDIPAAARLRRRVERWIDRRRAR